MADSRNEIHCCCDCGADVNLVAVDLGDTWAHRYCWMCADCIDAWDETGTPRWCAGDMANRLPV